MTSGIVFDIKEFAVHDGPGIRTTVFLKGCPLACSWCHNPEGRSREPQLIQGQAGNRMAGKIYTPAELVGVLSKQVAILTANGGGITFSGGEPLLQARFVAEVAALLPGVHLLLDTSGYASSAAFQLVAARMNLVYFDLKLIDPEAHLRFTGVSNVQILRNLNLLTRLLIPFVIRVPLIPGVTDTDANLQAIALTAKGLPALQRVDLLPYNQAAGGKYETAGMQFNPDYNENQPVNINTTVFKRVGVEVRVV